MGVEQPAGEVDDVLSTRARARDEGDELRLAEHIGPVVQQLLARALVVGEVVDGAVSVAAVVFGQRVGGVAHSRSISRGLDSAGVGPGGSSGGSSSPSGRSIFSMEAASMEAGKYSMPT